MKILIINDLLVHGGAEMQGHREKKILEEEGHEVYFLTFDSDIKNINKFNSQQNYINISIKNINALDKIKNRLIFSRKLYNEIITVIESIKPDIIHVNNLYIAPITQYKALKNYKVIQTIRDYAAVCPMETCIKTNGDICKGSKWNNCYKECGNSLKNILKIYINKNTNINRRKTINNFICPSEKLTEYCNDHGMKTTCINNPFDFEKFKDFKKVMPQSEKNYLYYGKIDDIKGLYKLLDAFVDFSRGKNDVKIYIAGKADNRNKERLRTYTENNDNINYLGYLSYEKTMELIKKVHTIVVPSLWMENYPNTVLEAISTKTLVLGSDRGGIPSMIKNQKQIFNVLDNKDIMNKLEYSYKLSTEEYNKIVEKGYEIAKENNSFSKFYERIINLFNSSNC